MNLSDFDVITQLQLDDLYDIDRWMLNQINTTSRVMTQYLDTYEYGQAKLEFERFFWHDFCDNYLEIIKDKIYKPEKYADGNKQKISAQFTLYHTFLAIIKLIAPYLPFITEELYQTYYQSALQAKSVHTLSYPNGDVYALQQDSLNLSEKVDEVLLVIEKVRGYKTEKQLGLGTAIPHLIVTSKHDISSFADDIMSGTRSEKVSFERGEEVSIQIA